MTEIIKNTTDFFTGKMYVKHAGHTIKSYDKTQIIFKLSQTLNIKI
jgi:hypothetical protein